MNLPPQPTPRPFPADQTVHGLFHAQAASTPHRTAVIHGSSSWSYAELSDAATRIAQQLRHRNIGPGALVGLCAQRSLLLPAAVLGILQSGAAYVPMDPAFPAERLRMMVEDAQLAAIATERPLLDLLPHHQAELLLLDDPSPLPPSPLPPSPPPATPLAYVIFTSGSTGRPKGVQITHRSFVNFLHSMRREPGCSPDDVLLSVTTLSFDIAGLELMLPLTTGAAVVIASREMAANGEQLVAELERTHATLMQATPATWRLLLACGWKGSPRLKILVGGESVPRDLVNQLAPRCASLWNMYGPTETTIWSTTGQLLAGEGPVSIGKPIDNTQIYIVDPHLAPLPAHTPGEILIGGEGVALGYLGRPDLTSARFVPDPFSSVPGSRLYRTGDLGQWAPDGSFLCLGRLDDQIKIRGYRVELGDIESALQSHPQLRGAAVAAREITPGDTRLVAYVVPHPTHPHPLDFAVLREHVRARVPEYMVPALWVTLDQLPLTPNRKLDRKALPHPGPSAATPTSLHVPPHTTDESRMARLWCQTLKLERVGMSDGFFDLGGNSLLAVRLFAAIEQEFGRRLPLATLLHHATPRALLAQTQQTSTAPWNSIVLLQAGNPSFPPFFCIHGAGGNLLLYRDLVAALGPDLPLFGIQSRGLDGRTPPLPNIEAMAQAYVEELLTLVPHGPLLLGGYCMGGTVAYEMAQRLTALHRQVALLALFDTYNFADRIRFTGPLGKLRRLTQKLRFHLANLLEAKGQGRWDYLRAKLRLARNAADSLRHRPPTPSPNPTPAGLSVESVNHEAGMNYQPSPIPVKLTVFKPRRSYADYPDPMMGWKSLAQAGLDIVELPLNPHAMLVAPYVQHLARELRPRLEAVGGGSPSPVPPLPHRR